MKNYLSGLAVCLVLFSSCSKQKTGPNESEISLPKVKAAPDLYQGACPYDCHDLRCQSYQTGYCGIPNQVRHIIGQ